MSTSLSKRGKGIAVCVGAAMLLAACGTSSTTSSSSAGASSGSAAGGSEDITVAVEYGGLKFPYHSALKAGITAKAAELGGITIIEGDSNGDTGTELTNIQNLLSRSPDCLLLIPVSNSSSAAAEAADAAKVPVVSFDQEAAGPTAAFVGYDQLQSGTLLGEFVVDQYKAIGKPLIKVIYLRGLIGQAADTSRNEGMKKALADAGLDESKVQIIEQAADYDRSKAQSITNDLLTQNPDVDVIVANNDDMMLGAYSAAEALTKDTGPKGTLHLSGIDGVPEALQLISDGKVDATIFQDPVVEANTALPVCVAAARGETVSNKVLEFKTVEQANAAEALASVQSVYGGSS